MQGLYNPLQNGYFCSGQRWVMGWVTRCFNSFQAAVSQPPLNMSMKSLRCPSQKNTLKQKTDFVLEAGSSNSIPLLDHIFPQKVYCWGSVLGKKCWPRSPGLVLILPSSCLAVVLWQRWPTLCPPLVLLLFPGRASLPCPPLVLLLSSCCPLAASCRAVVLCPPFFLLSSGAMMP